MIYISQPFQYAKTKRDTATRVGIYEAGASLQQLAIRLGWLCFIANLITLFPSLFKTEKHIPPPNRETDFVYQLLFH